MDEYIKKEAAIKLLRGEAVAKYPMSFYMGLFAASDEITKIPAADVVEVVHGRWVCLEPEIGYYACSLCDHRILRAESPYCPHCGAKMDGERKDGASDDR